LRWGNNETGDDGRDGLAGSVFEITDTELDNADKYEVAAYRRYDKRLYMPMTYRYMKTFWNSFAPASTYDCRKVKNSCIHPFISAGMTRDAALHALSMM
jgi:hypothetical protein